MVVVEDEPLALRRLTRMLASDSACDVVGTAGDGMTAAALIHKTDPDVVFLDIQIPGQSGLSLASDYDARPAVIFVTAFQEYAADAFGIDAVDYLVKPVRRSRLYEALGRARRWLDANATHDPVVFAQVGARFHPVDTADVDRFEARDDYVAAFVGDREFLLSTTMKELENLLPVDWFLRVHRSVIVNLRRVREFSPDRDGHFRVILDTGRAIIVSRRRAPIVRSALRARGYVV